MHFDLDPIKTEDLTAAWRNLGFSRLPLDVVECADRRIPRAAAELVATALADGETEVSVLVPRRQYTHFWHRFLHDRTADAITQALAGSAAQQRDDRPLPPRFARERSAAGRPTGTGRGDSAVAANPWPTARFRRCR